MNNSPSIGKIIPAFIKAQTEIRNVTKDRNGENFKYADWPQTVEVIRNATLYNDLVFSQPAGPVIEKEIVTLECVLFHASGEYISQWCQTFVDNTMKNKTQGAGSALTYLKRKSAISFWLIGEEDEIDARNASMGKPSAPRLEVIEEEPALIQLQRLISQSSDPEKTEHAILAKSEVNHLAEMQPKQLQYYVERLSLRTAR